jgi:hypothetical protein
MYGLPTKFLPYFLQEKCYGHSNLDSDILLVARLIAQVKRLRVSIDFCLHEEVSPLLDGLDSMLISATLFPDCRPLWL